MTSAAVVLREIEAQGGTVRAEGERLRIKAPRPLPAPLMEQARAVKLELLKILRGTQWDGDDWRAWITERAAILEHDGGLSRDEADRRAFEHALVEWLNRHPPQPDPGRCAGCGNPINESGTDWRPLADAAIIHYAGPWGLHCMEQHGLRRREEAAAALAASGLRPPR